MIGVFFTCRDALCFRWFISQVPPATSARKFGLLFPLCRHLLHHRNECSSPYDSFGPSVRSTLDLLCPRLTSANPSHRLSTLLALPFFSFCFADRQISPGNAHPFQSYDRRIYVHAFWISLGL